MPSLRKKLTAGIAAVMVVVVALLRIAIVPNTQNAVSGRFTISYVVIGVISVALIVMLVLSRTRGNCVPRLSGGALLPVTLSGMLFGATLVLNMLYDVWNWIAYHVTPAPNQTIIGVFDAVTLILTIVFGLLGGGFLVWLCLRWSASGQSVHRIYKWMPVMPVLWMWMRLARYELSYASAVDVTRSFYDFVMLIFSLLFLFAFARYVSGVGKPSRWLLFFSAATALLSLSGTIAQAGFVMLLEREAYYASQLAGFPDFTLGLFALCLTFALAFSPEETFDNGEELPVPDSPKGIETDDWEEPSSPEEEGVSPDTSAE